VNEGRNLEQTLAHAGRSEDTIVVSVDSPWRCDPLAAYFDLPGATPAGAAKTVVTLSQLADRYDGRVEAFWQQAGERLSLLRPDRTRRRFTFGRRSASFTTSSPPSRTAGRIPERTFARRFRRSNEWSGPSPKHRTT